MESLIPVLLLALIILPAAFLYNEHQKRNILKDTHSKNADQQKQRLEAIENDISSLNAECKSLRSQLTEVKTDVASVKVSLGWSKD